MNFIFTNKQRASNLKPNTKITTKITSQLQTSTKNTKKNHSQSHKTEKNRTSKKKPKQKLSKRERERERDAFMKYFKKKKSVLNGKKGQESGCFLGRRQSPRRPGQQVSCGDIANRLQNTKKLPNLTPNHSPISVFSPLLKPLFLKLQFANPNICYSMLSCLNSIWVSL